MEFAENFQKFKKIKLHTKENGKMKKGMDMAF
jgi:hypothetical protein